MNRHKVCCGSCERKVSDRLKSINTRFKRNILFSRLMKSNILAHGSPDQHYPFFRLKPWMILGFDWISYLMDIFVRSCLFLFHAYSIILILFDCLRSERYNLNFFNSFDYILHGSATNHMIFLFAISLIILSIELMLSRYSRIEFKESLKITILQISGTFTFCFFNTTFLNPLWFHFLFLFWGFISFIARLYAVGCPFLNEFDTISFQKGDHLQFFDGECQDKPELFFSSLSLKE